MRSTSASAGLNQLGNGSGNPSEENLVTAAGRQYLDAEIDRVLQDKCDLSRIETVSPVKLFNFKILIMFMSLLAKYQVSKTNKLLTN